MEPKAAQADLVPLSKSDSVPGLPVSVPILPATGTVRVDRRTNKMMFPEVWVGVPGDNDPILAAPNGFRRIVSRSPESHLKPSRLEVPGSPQQKSQDTEKLNSNPATEVSPTKTPGPHDLPVPT